MTIQLFRPLYATLLCSIVSPVVAQVVVTEIMYDPRSSEADPNRTEWLEIYNAGKEAVDLSGWRLKDEDGETLPIAEGERLEPQAVAILITSAQEATHFQAAWGKETHVIRLGNWNTSLKNLSNDPGDGNELLGLHDANGELVDAVHYDDAGDWPKVGHGPSIVLAPDKLDAKSNDDGKSWRLAKVGEAGAFKCRKIFEYGGQDIGSPGLVVTKDDAPLTARRANMPTELPPASSEP